MGVEYFCLKFKSWGAILIDVDTNEQKAGPKIESWNIKKLKGKYFFPNFVVHV